MDEYLDIIYEYYPQDIPVNDPKYLSTDENVRLWKLIDDARSNKKDNDYFKNMAGAMVKQLNCRSHLDVSLRGAFDLCRKTVLYLPDNQFHAEYPCCVINISIVAPFYSIYFTKFSSTPINTLNTGAFNEIQTSLVDNLISRIIKTHYEGYQSFPMDYFNEPVPGVYSPKNYNKYATYYSCLITDDVL